jgi:hypothetical protein
MIFAVLLLLTGLTISTVAIYYSVIGLTAVFAAAFWPVVVMGVTLEIAKLVAATWLKAEWHRIPIMLKTYLSIAVVVLMVITSMGIFGFLSKAHLDNNLIGGDVVDKVAIIDEKIKTERDNIDAARKALKQMDEAVDQTMARSTSEQGADKAAVLRRAQQRERTALQRDITNAQGSIAKLNEQRAPIAKDLRKVEAEVGPIKYIAKLIYGDNPDTNILEKAVTWVIMLIVFVFDPLAVLLLISAQMAYKWAKEEKDQEENATDLYVADVGEKPTEEELKDDFLPTYEEITPNSDDAPNPINCYKCGTELVNAPGIGPFCPNKACDVFDGPFAEDPVAIITVDTTDTTADEKALYESGHIDQLTEEVVAKLDEEKSEDDLKKKTAFMIKDQNQQVLKVKQ